MKFASTLYALGSYGMAQHELTQKTFFADIRLERTSFIVVHVTSGLISPGDFLHMDSSVDSWPKTLSVDRKNFNMFFERMMDGFAYHKIIVDNEGKPVDYVFLEVNNAFEKMTGLTREKIIGKKVTEVLKGIENDPADWIGKYGKVALTCEPAQFENFAEALGKWYSVSAYCPDKGYFVTLFEDITERKKAEEALRQLNETLEQQVHERTVAAVNERQRLFQVLETLPAYVVLLDKNYQVSFANKVFREAFRRIERTPLLRISLQA